MFDVQQCGLCRKPGATHFWQNHLSSYIHPKCFQLVQEEINLLQTIFNRNYFNTEIYEPYRNIVQKAVLQKIQTKIGDISILDYKNNEKSNGLLKVFLSPEVVQVIKEFKV